MIRFFEVRLHSWWPEGLVFNIFSCFFFFFFLVVTVCNFFVSERTVRLIEHGVLFMKT